MAKTNCFATTQVQTGNIYKCSGSPQGNESQVTSIKNGKGAVGNYYIFKPGVADYAVYATAFKENDGTSVCGFIIPEAISFDISGIKQPAHFTLVNRAAYAHTGKLCIKLYKSSTLTPTPADLTAVSAVFESANIAFSATAGERKDIMVYPEITGSLSSQYVVLVLNWKVVVAGGNVNAGVKLAFNGASGSFIDLIY